MAAPPDEVNPDKPHFALRRLSMGVAAATVVFGGALTVWLLMKGAQSVAAVFGGFTILVAVIVAASGRGAKH